MSTTKRRNGQLSSCEPCRKAKLRCDHATPICGRCAHRGQESACIYHPAPMTQPRPVIKKAELKKKRKREPTLLTEKGITSTSFLQRYRISAVDQNPHRQASPQSKHQATDETDQSEVVPDGSTETARFRKSVFSTGFLGPSSFWAAFDEPSDGTSSRGQATTTATATATATSAASTYPTPSQASPDTESPPTKSMITAVEPDSTIADADQIECGARILVLLEDLSLYQNLIHYRFTIVEPWVFGKKLVTEALAGVYLLRQQWRQGSKLSQAKLLTWSERLFENSSKPIVTHADMTITEYFSSVAARWEMIGVVFSWVGVAALMIPDDHESLRSDEGSIIDVQKLRNLALEVTEICLGFCDSVGTLSDPLVWLLLQQTILLGEVHGDTDYRTWRKLGDLSTVIFALGLHRPKSDPSIPLFLVEMRKRAMAAGFAVDKQLATLLGRPPRIAYQYCDIQYPLDLSYEKICKISEGKEDDDLTRHIGPDGWNLEEIVTSGTRARVNVMLGVIREKVLALSLSPHSDDLEQRVSATCREHDQMRLSLPPKLEWQPNIHNTNDSQACLLEVLHLEFLHNDFILYSVLIRRTGEHKDRLIQAARKMLSTLVSLVSSRAPSMSASFRSSWDLCYMGLPCAGVLAQELLQRSQRKHCHMPPLPATTTAKTRFPRSEVIQNLSVFASLLETALHIRDGNYGIARRGLDAIRNILDRVLSCDDNDASEHQPRQVGQVEKQPPSPPPPPQRQQQHHHENHEYEVVPDPAMARYAGPPAAELALGSVPQQQKHEIPNIHHQPPPPPPPPPPQPQSSILMQQDPSITTSYTAIPANYADGLAPGADNINSNTDNFLPLDFMSWLDNLDWAQESLLNYS